MALPRSFGLILLCSVCCCGVAAHSALAAEQAATEAPPIETPATEAPNADAPSAGAPDADAPNAVASTASNSSTDDRLAPTPENIGHWVTMLGDGVFDNRELAVRRLSQIGLPAKSALEEAVDSRDAEVRYRARRLLAVLSQNDLEQRLDRLLVDPSESPESDLPGWKGFQSQYGSSSAARKLYADMIREDAELFYAMEDVDDEKRLSNAMQRRLAIMPRLAVVANRGGRGAKAEAMLCLLYVASQRESVVDAGAAAQMHMLLSHQSLSRILQERNDRGELARQILCDWALASPLTSNHLSLVSILSRHQLHKEAVELALRSLEENSLQTHAVPSMFSLIVQHRNHADPARVIAVLETYLENGTQVRVVTLQNQTLRSELRDAALVTLIYMTNQDHKAYPFVAPPNAEAIQQRIQMSGFADEKDRQAALQKWAEWKAANPEAFKPKAAQAEQPKDATG